MNYITVPNPYFYVNSAFFSLCGDGGFRPFFLPFYYIITYNLSERYY